MTRLDRLHNISSLLYLYSSFRPSLKPMVFYLQAGRDVFVVRIGAYRLFWTVELRQRESVFVQEIRVLAFICDNMSACSKFASRIVRYRESLGDTYVECTRERRLKGQGEFEPCEFHKELFSKESVTNLRRELPGADNNPLTNAKCFALSAETMNLLISGDFVERKVGQTD